MRFGEKPPLIMALTALMALFLLTACPATDPESTTTGNASSTHPNNGADMRRDVHSHARPDEVAVSHLDLDLNVDFTSKRLTGRASLKLDHRAATHQLHLDTNGLDIRKVTLDDSQDAATFKLGEAQDFLGRELTIDITPDTRVVHIDYASDPSAKAVQWLSPEQTAGGKHPFLFTQSQAILARTWVPCQDSPAVRMTYNATIRVPTELMAVMSADNPTEKATDGVYHFSMPQAIPSYLLALAVGDLEFRDLGEQTGVFAEPSVVEKAAYEFAETEDMIKAVENLYGPYLWGRFDILVLPPSFPFGGMENPRLTFATPTILAGDRSLVSLIAHELAHSWSGNLVTNATWNDFWLNEGFTVYLERRIMEAIEGKDYADMLALLGFQDLQASLTDLEARDTHLHLDLDGRDADDGMTDIAYEKGYSFLRSIEETVGREPFDTFLKVYFDKYKFQSLTTTDFVNHLKSELIADNAELAKKLDLDTWIHGPGLPDNVPRITSDAFTAVEAELAAWQNGRSASELATGDWTTHEWLHFLRSLPETLSAEQMAQLDASFSFTDTGNSEVLHAWLHHVIQNRHEAGYDALEGFLTGMGRRKFLAPLYRRLATTEEGLARAKKIYEKARPAYHSVSSSTIDEVLGIK